MAPIKAQLERLENAQLLRRLADEELAYLFKHALIQESAYGSLLLKDRRELHRRVARVYEKLHADRLDEFAALLAEHYSRAGDDANTLEYSIRAGEVAARVFANIEALSHYSRALDTFNRMPDTEELRRRHADVILQYLSLHWGTALSDEEFALATQAETLAHSLRNPDGTLGDLKRLARVRGMRAGGHLARGEYQEAIRSAQQLLDQGPALADETLAAGAAAQIGVALAVQGHFAEAEPFAVQAISLMDPAPDHWEWISAVGTLGISLTMRGQIAEGLRQVERALARAETTQNRFGITICRAFLLLAELELGDMPRMLESSERAIEAAVQSGHPLYASLGLGFRALAQSRVGQLADAQETLNQTFEVKSRIGTQLMASDWLDAIRMEVLHNMGKSREALALAEQTTAVARACGGIFAESWARRTWAQAMAKELSPWDEVEERFTESVRLFEVSEARVEAARTHVAWGQASQARGLPGAAREHFEKAAAQFQTLGLVHDLERTRQLIASLAV